MSALLTSRHPHFALRESFVVVMLLSALGAGPVPLAGQDPQDAPPAPAIPIHLAALQGNVDAVAGHLAAGTDVDQVDAFGSTPLIVATTFGRTEVARLLVEAGADATLRNPDGSAPIHIAAFLGRSEVVELLLEHGADPRLRTLDGASAFDLAVVEVEHDRASLGQLRTGLAPLGLTLDEAQVAEGRAGIVALVYEHTPLRVEAASFAPERDGDWRVSTPSEQGLDPAQVARLYDDAADLDAIRSVLLVKGGALVGEAYYNDGARERPSLVQSVTKSVTSALVGVALEQGCLADLDHPMIDHFVDESAGIADPRKGTITLRQMLEMRSGWGYEPGDSALWAGLNSGDYLPQIVDAPLVNDPGTRFEYSNLTSHLLGVIVSRACEADLQDFAEANLFGPLEIEAGDWAVDADGYRYGYAGLHLTARDMARFGLLYLNGGVWDGRQVLPSTWVEASLTARATPEGSTMLPTASIGRHFRDVAYGYQWWSAEVGGRRVDFAWGYGGQLIVVLRDLDMAVVVTSDPFVTPERVYRARTAEQAAFNIVGAFIRSLAPAGAG